MNKLRETWYNLKWAWRWGNTRYVIAYGLVIILGLALAGFIIVGVYGLLALALQWAWNVFVPAVFHGPKLNYWQAVGLLVLLAFVETILKRK